MWNADLWGEAGSKGVERRGEEAQHMASFLRGKEATKVCPLSGLAARAILW